MRPRLASVLHEVALPAVLLLALLSAALLRAIWPAQLALCVLCARCVRFAFADADLTLLSLGARLSPRALAGRACWVVGASQGLGEAVALQLARGGAALLLSSRRVEECERVAAACRALGAASACALPFDLLDAGAVEEAARKADSQVGPAGLSHLFLLAGGTQRAAFAETEAAVDERLMRLNCLAPISLARQALPALRRARGRVTFVASAAAKLASPGQASYAASKWALAGFGATLRAESGGSVRVTLVCPGPVATGQPGQPRVTFGATLGGGAAAPAAAGESARLRCERAAELVVAAAGHGVREAWVAKHPVLLLLWLGQYCPLLASSILDTVGPKRTRAAQAGGDMYAAAGLAGAARLSAKREA